MKNREYMVNLLNDSAFVDDGGASYESMLHYNVRCPFYYGDKRALCDGYETEPTRDVCSKCKEKWLDSEVDE